MSKVKKERIIKVGLIGNPNTGKTSLLNCLAGLNLEVGNWPGKTVEKKSAKIDFENEVLEIVDLPGTYSISPYSHEEKVTRQFIDEVDPDVIVQTIDVNSLERNLLLTLELLEFGKKVVLAFNFNQEAKDRGFLLDMKKIEKAMQVPVVKIEANCGENTNELLKKIIQVSSRKLYLRPYLKELFKEKGGEIKHPKVLEFFKKEIYPHCKICKKKNQSRRLDMWVFNKFTALPIFFLSMFLLFKLTFWLSEPLVSGVNFALEESSLFLENINLSFFLSSFLNDAFLGGLGAVVSFAPMIFVLFFLIGILEDSGYLTRVVVLIDRLFRFFGISGRTFIPMILGFACNVPAIMATRIIRDRRERLIAIFTNSFISCSARLPVYVLFINIFFKDNKVAVLMFLYVFGVLISLLISLVLSRFMKKDGDDTLIMELAPYRIPSLKNVLRQAWFQTKMFLRKAGTVIFLAAVLSWILSIFPLGVEYGSSESYFGKLGQLISPIFTPLGFGQSVFAVSLLFGIFAKENIIGVLATFFATSELGLGEVLPGIISSLGAFSFLVFVLLYVPCFATIAVIKKESGSWKFTFFQIFTSFVLAWAISFIVYQGGMLLK